MPKRRLLPCKHIIAAAVFSKRKIPSSLFGRRFFLQDGKNDIDTLFMRSIEGNHSFDARVTVSVIPQQEECQQVRDDGEGNNASFDMDDDDDDDEQIIDDECPDECPEQAGESEEGQEEEKDYEHKQLEYVDGKSIGFNIDYGGGRLALVVFDGGRVDSEGDFAEDDEGITQRIAEESETLGNRNAVQQKYVFGFFLRSYHSTMICSKKLMI